MIKYYRRLNGSGTEEMGRLMPDTWVYAQEPTEQEFETLVRMDGLRRDLLHDAVDPHEVPRVQQEGQVTYFFLRAPIGQGEQMRTMPLLIAITPTFLLTVSQAPFSWLERFVHGSAPYNTAWRSQLMWRLMMALTTRHQDAVNDISRRVRSDLASIQNIGNEDLVRLVAYESVLNDVLAALQPMQAMLASINTGRLIKLYDEDKDLMEDVTLGNGQVVEAARAQLRMTASTREAYSLVTANELNKFIKLLTSLSLIMTVPNLVVNFWSMNIALPLQHNPHMFAFMVVSMLALIAALTLVFRRRKLL